MTNLRQQLTAWKHKATVLVAATALLVPISSVSTVFAAGSASFSLSPTSGSYNTNTTFTVSVYIAGSNVSGGTANVQYDTAHLQCQSIAMGGSFDVYIPAYETCGTGTANISALSSSAPLSGSQLFTTITFKTLSTATSAATVGIVAGSGGSATQIDDTISANIWDGATPSANFAVTTPVTTPPPTTTPPSSGGGSSSGGSSGGTSKPPTSSGGSSSSGGTTSQPPTTSPGIPAPNPTYPVNAEAPKNCSLSITVTDKKGKPIANVKVIVDDHYSEYTDKQGKAGFSGLVSGTHNVTVSGSGKTTQKTTLQLSNNETKNVSLKVASTTSPLLLAVYAIAGLAILGGAGLGALKLSGKGKGGISGGTPAWAPSIVVGSQQGSSTPTTPVVGSTNTPVAGSTVKPTDDNIPKDNTKPF